MADRFDEMVRKIVTDGRPIHHGWVKSFIAEQDAELAKKLAAALRTVAEETKQRCAEVAQNVHDEVSLYPCPEDSTVGCAVAEQIATAILALDLDEAPTAVPEVTR